MKKIMALGVIGLMLPVVHGAELSGAPEVGKTVQLRGSTRRRSKAG